MALSKLYSRVTDFKTPPTIQSKTHQADPSPYVNRSVDTQAAAHLRALGARRTEDYGVTLGKAAVKKC